MSKYYFVEVGVLWEDEENLPSLTYRIVYDGQYGYYDEDQYFVKDFDKAKQDVKKIC